MGFCCQAGCNDLSDESIQVNPPDGKVYIYLCTKHAKSWRLKDAAEDIKRNPPYGSEWNKRYGKRKTNT